jgi:hypothetical protein
MEEQIKATKAETEQQEDVVALHRKRALATADSFFLLSSLEQDKDKDKE